MRIVSLLPSATEIVFALGLGDDLAGVTFECDFPSDARTKAVVSGTALPTDRELSAAEIDATVAATVAAGESVYTLDAERIRSIGPDLILAQDLCRVCAVPSGAVEDALSVLGCRAEVVSLDPATLDEVIDCVGVVGAAIGARRRASEAMADLRARVECVRDAVAARARPNVLALEWSDPPFSGGHWVPDMISAAGGDPLLATSGQRSQRLSWDAVAAVDADVVVFMPCGYDLEATLRERGALLGEPALDGVPVVWAVNGTAYFSRPGPRVVDGVELLAWMLHPDAGIAPPADAAVRLRPPSR